MSQQKQYEICKVGGPVQKCASEKCENRNEKPYKGNANGQVSIQDF